MINVTNVRTCEESETLKDILWYIQGAIDQSKLQLDCCNFNASHINALEIAIKVLNEKAREIKE